MKIKSTLVASAKISTKKCPLGTNPSITMKIGTRADLASEGARTLPSGSIAKLMARLDFLSYPV